MDDRQIECALDELRVYLLRLIGLFIVVGGLVGVGVYLMYYYFWRHQLWM